MEIINKCDGVAVEIFIYARWESGVLSRREALRIIMIWMHLKFYSLSFTNNSSRAHLLPCAFRPYLSAAAGICFGSWKLWSQRV